MGPSPLYGEHDDQSIKEVSRIWELTFVRGYCQTKLSLASSIVDSVSQVSRVFLPYAGNTKHCLKPEYWVI